MYTKALKKAYSVQETFLCITFENACSSIFQGGLQDLQASFLACVKMKLFILCKSMLVIFSRWFKNLIFIHGETELVTTLKNGDYCICIKRRTCELPFPVSFAFFGFSVPIRRHVTSLQCPRHKTNDLARSDLFFFFLPPSIPSILHSSLPPCNFARLIPLPSLRYLLSPSYHINSIDLYTLVSFPFLCVRLFRPATISVAPREHSAPNVIALAME